MRHDYQDRVSLEIGRRIGAGLPHRPDWLALARENLERWTARNRDAPALLRAYAEWRAILDRPLSEIVAILTAESEEGQRLRQNSPFPGAIPYREVWDIKRQIRNGYLSASVPSQPSALPTTMAP